MSAQRKLKKPKITPRGQGVSVDRFAANHARYETATVYVFPTDDPENAGAFKVSRNLDINLLDAWITPEEGFSGKHLRHAWRCRDLWAAMPKPNWREQDGEGRRHARAARTLMAMKHNVRRDYWEIFENALRWNEPGGYIGSRLVTPPPHYIAAAKEIVRRVIEATWQ